MSNQIETPMVDAEACDGWSGDAECVGADFARTLERELIALQSKPAAEMDKRNLKYHCFRAEYGFAVYDPNDGSTKYTQNVDAATEATKEDWSDVLGLELVHYKFVPANITINRLFNLH